jgi:carbonic anhydrase
MKALQWCVRVTTLLVLGVAQAHAQPQSPIDLVDGLPITVFSDALDFSGYPNNIPAGLVVENEGSPNKEKSVKVYFDPIPGTVKMKVGATDYGLLNLHFHKRSEHLRNGREYKMELHLVHKSAAGVNLAVGMWIKAGDENQALKEIFENIPPSASGLMTQEVFNLSALLPPADKRQTFRYDGSLTTPHDNSTTHVKWIMFNEPISMSQAQIDAFGSFWPEGNFREVKNMGQYNLQTDVPEPSAAIVLAIAASVVAFRRWRTHR